MVKDPSGVINTPGYPSAYPEKLMEQCYWKILAPKGTVVRVDFSSFRLQTRECVYIVFAINGRFPIWLLRCGKNPSFVLYSMTNELGIKFRQSLISTTGPGFIANYTTIPAGKSERLERHATLLSRVKKGTLRGDVTNLRSSMAWVRF